MTRASSAGEKTTALEAGKRPFARALPAAPSADAEGRDGGKQGFVGMPREHRSARPLSEGGTAPTTACARGRRGLALGGREAVRAHGVERGGVEAVPRRPSDARLDDAPFAVDDDLHADVAFDVVGARMRRVRGAAD